MENFHNILIVRTDRIGDLVLTTPAIKKIRESYPNSKISILINSYTKDLVTGNPYLDEVLIDDRSNDNKGLFGFIKLVRMIKSKRFDIALIFHTKKRTNLTCFLSGIPKRIGYKNNKFGFLLTHPVEDKRHLGKKHETQYCFDILDQLGIDCKREYSNPDDLELYIPIREENELWTEHFITQNGIKDYGKLIAIHPGASDPSKMWPSNFFIEIIDELNEKYECSFVIIGGANIRSIARDITSSTKAQIYDLAGLITLGQLSCLLKNCNLLISNDSGPVHISSAVKTPVISIFTRNQPGINMERWRPLGVRRSKVVSVDSNIESHFSDIDKISFKKSQQIDTKYLEIIKPQVILEAVDSVFKLC